MPRKQRVSQSIVPFSSIHFSHYPALKQNYDAPPPGKEGGENSAENNDINTKLFSFRTLYASNITQADTREYIPLFYI